jgi:hypothetical protein
MTAMNLIARRLDRGAFIDTAVPPPMSLAGNHPFGV